MQVDIHAPWGGVVPKLAQEAHERAMDSTVEAALREAGISQEQLEGVAVTIGPGLSLCLQVYTLPMMLRTLRASQVNDDALIRLWTHMLWTVTL